LFLLGDNSCLRVKDSKQVLVWTQFYLSMLSQPCLLRVAPRNNICKSNFLTNSDYSLI
jgi:hypothetical protein